MPESVRNGHRNGGRVKAVPTTDRGDLSKPHNIRSTITNAPDPLLYGICFVVLIFGVTFVIIGGVYSSQCQLQPMLPIWLLVMGLILLFIGVFMGLFVNRTKKEPFRRINTLEKASGGVLCLLYLGWFIAGNIWVYSAWDETPDYGHHWFENGCNKSVFLMSFIAIITMDALVGFMFIGLCFWGVTKVVVRE